MGRGLIGLGWMIFMSYVLVSIGEKVSSSSQWYYYFPRISSLLPESALRTQSVEFLGPKAQSCSLPRISLINIHVFCRIYQTPASNIIHSPPQKTLFIPPPRQKHITKSRRATVRPGHASNIYTIRLGTTATMTPTPHQPFRTHITN